METIETENLPPPQIDPEDQCDTNPEFAIICSFISNFGNYIDLELDIEELKNSIEDQDVLHDSLIETHVKLFKKLRRYFVRDQWEKAVIRFAYEYSYGDGSEIDSMGYLKTRPSIRIRVLRRLLDAQFECDPKFKAAVNLLEANKLNLKSAGRDNEGNTYWPCVDSLGNLRLYREEPLKHNSWVAICKNVDDLKQLIEHLDNTKDIKAKGQPQIEPYDPYPEIFPELFIKVETEEDKAGPKVNKSNRKGTKRGKKKGRVFKKPKAPPSIHENHEVTTQSGLESGPGSGSIEQQIYEPQDDRPRSLSPNESIESQVKHTLENIVSKVVSSFDFIFRRLSPEVKREVDVVAPDQKPKQSRKRLTKREKPQIEDLPRRSSSRIQQLQQKKIEEEAIKKQSNSMKMENSRLDRPSEQPHNPRISDPSSKREKKDKKDKQRWRNNKGKKKLSWDRDDSDLSSISSPSESNDESFMEALNESIDHNDDDEFACEDEATNDEPVIIKRARTARQALDLDETDGLNNTTIIEEDKPCGRCDGSNDPDWILLCDMCDDGYHTTCCVPPLMYVPDGDWFCPPCEQKMLLNRLREILESVVETLAAKERERQKRQRLRQPAVKKENSTKPDEILNTKRQRDILNELNEPLAVQALDDLTSSSGEELPPSYREGCSRLPRKKFKKTKKRAKRRYTSDEDESDYELNRGRKKKDHYIVSDSEFEEDVDDDEEDEDFDEDRLTETSSDDGEQLKTRKARAFVSYKFEEYDELIQSAICGDSDGELKTRGERSNPEPCNIGRGKDMATIEALAYQQENGLTGELNPVNQTKQRRRGRKLNDLDAESEIDIATSDESFQASSATEDLDDDDEVTEVSSEEDSSMDEIVCMHQSRSKRKKGRTKKRKRFSDDSEDSDFKPRSRRVAAKKVSYKESTDEEDEIVTVETNPTPMTSNPINDLTEYCSQSSYPSNPLYSSFKMSPPHPQFYKEDEVRPLPDDE